MALETLAAKQIGALVVVERGIGLRNHIESGIPLDAKLTYDLHRQHLPADLARCTTAP